jgi:hypothetical protein
MEKRRKTLKWLSGTYTTRYEELRNETVENSGQWFLNSEEFTAWKNGTGQNCIWCVGIRIHLVLFITHSLSAGAGKSILMYLFI